MEEYNDKDKYNNENINIKYNRFNDPTAGGFWTGSMVKLFFYFWFSHFEFYIKFKKRKFYIKIYSKHFSNYIYIYISDAYRINLYI